LDLAAEADAIDGVCATEKQKYLLTIWVGLSPTQILLIS
jgi:hypothetical protein